MGSKRDRGFRWGLSAALAAGATLPAGAAHAAGFASDRFGGEHGNAVATNPTSLYYNPAGMAFGHEGLDAFVDAALALRSASWNHTSPPPGPSDQPFSQAGNSGTAALFNVFGGPDIAATFRFGDLSIGGGVFAPFAGRESWGTNSAFPAQYPSGTTCAADGACPLAGGGVQRWHVTDGSLTFIYGTVGIAYRLGPLAIGASGNVIDSSMELTQAHTLSGPIDATLEDRGALSVSGLTGSFAVGAMLEALPRKLWLGLSYQAQPGLGPMMLTGSLHYTPGPSPYYSNSGTASYDVDFHQSLPDIVRWGARYRAARDLELRLFGDVTRWSKMRSQCINQAGTPAGTKCQVYPDGSTAAGSAAVLAYIPRNWHDTFGVRAGASYWVDPTIELFGGLGFETGAVPDSTLEPGVIDGNSIGIAAGVRLKVTSSLYLAGSYTHLQYLDRDNTGSSTLATNPTPEPPSNTTAVQVPTFAQDGGGKYSQWIGIFDVNAEMHF
jgi:long-chain fatty acid transport protein